jgi:hypothetical protein
VRELVERDALAIVVVAIWTALLACRLPALFVPDSWLTFVSGRLIAAHGLPHVDTLTAWTLGRRWTDQQWGAHLAYYELVRHGGTRAAGGVSLACVVVAVGGAAVAARKLGASPRSTAIGALLPLVGAPWLAEVRTQTLVLGAFVAVYALLAFDSRRPGNRVLLVLPLLALWANLHGSVALVAGLSAVHGLQRLRLGSGRATSLALVVGAPLTLFASPYGFDLARYYRSMLFNPVLARVDSEWQPVSLDRSTIAFVVSCLGVAALLGLRSRALTRFEVWVLPLLLVAAVSGVRHVVWFELGAAVSLPGLLDAAWPAQAPTAAVRKLNLALGSLVALVAAAIVVVQLARPPAWLEPAPVRFAGEVAAATGPNAVVLADDSQADWLLWHEPSLAGRVAYDVRFELLRQEELLRLVAVQQPSSSFWHRCGARFGVVTFVGRAWGRQLARRGVLAPDARVVVDSPAMGAIVQTPAGPSCRL